MFELSDNMMVGYSRAATGTKVFVFIPITWPVVKEFHLR